jgi:putative ABC transport system permease protein
MSWLRRLTNTLRPDTHRREIEREMAFHVAERAEQLRHEGLSEEEAHRRARLQFGNPLVQAEHTRDVDIALWLDSLFRNSRVALRALLRTPGFTITVVLTLALGIGANSAVFSMLDAVLLRPLPFPDADRLVHVSQIQDVAGETRVAPVRVEDWNARSRTFEALTGYTVEDVSDTTGTRAAWVRRAVVAPRFLRVWGVTPMLGRDLTDRDHRDGSAPVLLISHRYWRQRLGADPEVIGKSVRMADRAYTVIGVLPPTFLFSDRQVDWWAPAFVDAWYLRSRALATLRTIGRLKPGATLEEARADLARVQAQLAVEQPQTDRNLRIDVISLQDAEVGALRGSLWFLFGSVVVLLLIACVNIAALLLSQGAQREPEMALRYSLGASRSTLTVQLLTETAVIAVIGAAVGLVVALGVSAAFRRLAPALPRLDETAIDVRVLVYTMAVASAVVLVCGLFPALRVTRAGQPLARQAGARVSSRHRFQWALVTVQVTLSVTLLAGAGLLVRSFDKLSRIEPGFDANRVLTFRVSASMAEFGSYAPVVQRIHRTIDALAAHPGIDAVATARVLPGLPERQEQLEFRVTEVASASDARVIAELRTVSPSYFATLRIRTVAGEPCRRSDDFRAIREVMVNRKFAEAYAAGRSLVGLHLATTTPASVPMPMPMRIVGVVDDVREVGIDRDPVPTVYSCYAAPTPMPWYVVRTTGDPAAMVADVRRIVNALERLRSVYDIAPLDERIANAYAQVRLRTVVIVMFATTALALACLGLYGTLAYVVRVRRKEVGVRLALGAARLAILRLFLTPGLVAAAIGCAMGLTLSLALSQAIAGLLYGVAPSDPVTLSVVVVLVLGVSALAAAVPATRAALMPPIQTLHEE